MCGIFGHSRPADLKASRRALQTLAHRGPDQTGKWHDDQVYLGHQRLSIMDLSDAGRQPMTDGRVYITVNGEIYNYPDLKKQLERKYKFQSGSDSEVLIHGYLEWGLEKLLNKIEGMYAFVLYDAQKQKLFLVRDRAGIKPLYYSRINGRLAWASELKALMEFHKADRLEVDRSAVYDYLTYLYIPEPKSLYKDVYKLEPAHYLEADLPSGQVKKNRYWQLSTTVRQTKLATAAARTRELVNQAVKQQLMSDVPVGFFLSGGLDSSTVVAAASKLSRQLHTYSIGFDVKEHSETHYAELVAKHFKTKHLTRDLPVAEVKQAFPKIRDWYDEPFADTSAFPTHLVSKLARQTSTVVLTGDGGDEIFGGYSWYDQFRYSADHYVESRAGNRLIRKLRRQAKTAIDLELEYYAHMMGGLPVNLKPAFKKQLGLPAAYDDYWHSRKYYRPELPVLTRLQYMDFHTYLPGDILTKVDRASMAVALECRVPLLSTELVEYMFSLPESLRYHNDQLKGLMKYAFKNDLPEEILTRNKKGFSIPAGRWGGQLKPTKDPMTVYILNELFPELLN